MKISSLPNLWKKEEKEFYLSLILRNEKAKAVIFEKTTHTLKYVSANEEEFTSPIENASLEEFLSVLDKAISGAEIPLTSTVDKYKTILALKDNWIENEKIKKEYLDKLKKAGDELGLEPIGFLTFSESLTNLLQKEEGAPVTAIIAEVGKKYLTAYYIKSGRVMEAKTSEIHQGASFTVETLLKHLETPAVMPARIILINSDEDELTQEFINHQWSKSLNFLHIPQIQMLPTNSDIKAVLLGAATQMGAKLEFDASDVERVEQNKSFENVSEEKGIEGQNLDYVGKEGSMDFFGFSKSDVAKDVQQDKVSEKSALHDEALKEVSEEIPEDVKIKTEKKLNIGTLGVLLVEKAKSALSLFQNLLSKEALSSLRNGGIKDKKLLFIGLGIIALFIFFYFVFIFQTKATVKLAIDLQTLTKDESLTFSPNSTTNLDDKLLEAKIVPIEEEGSVTVDVKGKKDVGEKAKVTVTIFNNDTDPVSLAKGTIITSSNELDFLLDSGVSVASASGDVFSGTKPGTTNANVTAEDIGTEYNLPSDTKFTIGSNKSIGAKNDNAFSGCSKKNE